MVSLPSLSDDERERIDEYYRKIYCKEEPLEQVMFPWMFSLRFCKV